MRFAHIKGNAIAWVLVVIVVFVIIALAFLRLVLTDERIITLMPRFFSLIFILFLDCLVLANVAPPYGLVAGYYNMTPQGDQYL